jgi:sortase A
VRFVEARRSFSEGGWLERGLFAVGVLCVGWYLAVSAWALTYQRQAQAQIDRMAARPAAANTSRPKVGPFSSAEAHPAEAVGPAGPPAAVRKGELIGRLEIPRLGFSAAVAHGDDDGTLKVAIGHLPDTPLPWQAGNTGLAGHRDGFFRPLKDVKENDELRFVTPHGQFRYRVRHTNIVRPEDVWVLDATATPSLTLVTCYPFSYVGNAPQRFVIRAERIDS